MTIFDSVKNMNIETLVLLQKKVNAEIKLKSRQYKKDAENSKAESLLKKVSEITGICVYDMKSESRKDEIVFARCIFVFLCNKHNIQARACSSVLSKTVYSVYHYNRQINNQIRLKDLIKNTLCNEQESI